MFRYARPVGNAYRLYLGFQLTMALGLGIAQATIIVYWVTVGRLDPLQLVLLGTMVEAAYFLLQLPTGMLADLVSRRLCVVTGVFAVALGYLLQGSSPAFASLMAAQILVALGAALMYGAQESWIADELAQEAMTQVYIRAEQLGLAGAIVGSLISGFLALTSLRLPLLIGGGVLCLIAATLAVIMPERNFQRPTSELRPRAVLRGASAVLSEQVQATSRAVRAIPGLVLVFAMTFFLGMWSESFDRLWGDFLLKDVTFPHLLGMRPAMWFSVIACMVALLALGATELAGRRTKRLGPSSMTTTLLILTAAIAVLVVIMGTAHTFYVFVVAYLAVSALRPTYEPLVTGWMVPRVDAQVRATALSARDMCDSGGQIIGGPAIGIVGNLVSIRAALLAGAAALGPALGLLIAATRRIHATAAGAGNSPAAFQDGGGELGGSLDRDEVAGAVEVTQVNVGKEIIQAIGPGTGKQRIVLGPQDRQGDAEALGGSGGPLPGGGGDGT
jgi:MFS transporter, DHA3 family, tetracycline resistance protein